MSGRVRVIAFREVAAYFDSRIAAVFGIAFVVLANWLFMSRFFLTGVVDMTAFFDSMPVLLPFFIPAVTMRLWAEERRSRTIELLLTLPIRPFQAVLGKYLAALVLFGLALLGTVPIVVMLSVLGEPDLGLILSGYLGLFLMGGLFLSLGMFVSALSADQIVTFVLSALVCLLFVGTGNEWAVALLDGLVPSLSVGTVLYEWFSVMPHYDAFVRGVVGLPALIYFLLLSLLFLWMTAQFLEKARE
ncbi:MAG: ABC transporter permease [Planctomycetota bacterium]